MEIHTFDECIAQKENVEILEGAQQPQSRKRKQPEDVRAQQHLYEKEKRRRKWNPGWLIDNKGSRREWLHYDETSGIMSCTWCKGFAVEESHRRGPYVVGTTNYKLESIKEHEKSTGHERSAELKKAKEAPVSAAPGTKALKCSA